MKRGCNVVQRQACEPRYAGRSGIRDSGPGPRTTALVVQAAQAHSIDNQPYLVNERFRTSYSSDNSPRFELNVP